MNSHLKVGVKFLRDSSQGFLVSVPCFSNCLMKVALLLHIFAYLVYLRCIFLSGNALLIVNPLPMALTQYLVLSQVFGDYRIYQSSKLEFIQSDLILSLFLFLEDGI